MDTEPQGEDAAGELDKMRSTWNARGRADPLRSICTGTPRDLSTQEFLDSGIQELRVILDYVARLGIPLRTGRALDFGCGVGRITFALAARFDEVVGVDISDEMIRQANSLNRAGARVRFVHNVAGDLGSVPSGAFDFIVSDLVFQHIDPRLSRRYLEDLVRRLAAGGVAVVQIPGPIIRKGIARGMVARRAGATNGLDPPEVQRIVESAEGSVVDSRTSNLVYAGLADILAPGDAQARGRRKKLRQSLWGILADKRPSIAYAIRKRPVSDETQTTGSART